MMDTDIYFSKHHWESTSFLLLAFLSVLYIEEDYLDWTDFI